MANYAHAKEIIAANVYTNHDGQVTAEKAKTAINEVVDTLIAGGYLYAGIAHPGDAAVSPDANVFYFASEPGTYTNKGGLIVADGEVAIFKYNGSWSKEVTGAATAAQVTELGQQVIYPIERQIDGFYYVENGGYTAFNGWDFGDGKTHLVLQVMPGDTVKVYKNATQNTYFYVLKSYKIPVSGDTPDYSSTMNDRQTAPLEFTVPSDAYYIAVSGMTGGVDHIPAKIEVNGKVVVSGRNIEKTDYQILLESFKGVDAAPTRGSKKFTESGGIYEAIKYAKKLNSVDVTSGYYGYGYIKKSDSPGDINVTQSWKVFLFKRDEVFSALKVKAGSLSTNVFTIGFYTSDTLSNSTFISGVSSKGDGVFDYEEDIPTECTYIAVCTRIENLDVPSIEFIVNNVTDSLNFIINELQPEGIVYDLGDAEQLTKGFWRLTSGNPDAEMNTESAAWHSYIFSQENLNANYIIAKLAVEYSNTACGIVFLSGRELVSQNIISFVPLTAGEHIYTVGIPDGCKRFIISSRIYSAPFGEVQIIKNASNGEDYIKRNNITNANKNINHIVQSMSAFYGRDYTKVQHKYLTILHGSDFHGDENNFMRFLSFANLYENDIDCSIVTGDITDLNFSDPTFENLYKANYQKFKKPCLTLIGNHETGDDAYGGAIYTFDGNVNSIDNCAARFITPFMSHNGCVQPTGKGYYYKDFSNYKIRIIALMEYEMPRIANDAQSYKYDYWYRYISQAQAEWLVNTLNSVPSDYGVIILMHQMPDAITEYDNKFNSMPNHFGFKTAQGPIIQDIIDAYIDKGTLAKTYSNTISADVSEVPDVTVSADFTSANGEFICYLVGHTHYDKLGKSSIAANTQLVVVMNTSGSMKAYYDDLWRQHGCKSQDCFNMVVIDTDLKKIRLLRVGADCNLNMEYRDVTSVSYIE